MSEETNRHEDVAASDPDGPEAFEGTLMDGLENEPPYPSATPDRQEGARNLVRLMWPLRHDFNGARVTLRSFLRLARKQRAI